MTTRRDALKMMAAGGAVVWTAPMIHTVAAAQQGGSPGPDCTRAQEGDTNLVGADLTNCDLSGADLNFANLTDANLTNANLTNAFLSAANLTNADLTDADLTNAFLTDALLTNANLTNADLTNANLIFANLTDADLTSCTGPGNGTQNIAVFNNGTICSDGTTAGANGGTCVNVGPGW